MVKVNLELRKTTRLLYKKIYLARIEGNSHSRLMVMFKCSKQKVERAILWCRKIGFYESPKDDEITMDMIQDLFNQKAMLRNEMKKKDVSLDDKRKTSAGILKLNEQILIIKGLIEHKLGIKVEDISKVSNEDLMKFINQKWDKGNE